MIYGSEALPRLTASEEQRYARHLALPDFDVVAQQKLKAAKVLVVGAGGLGSPLLLYLAAAGVGKIGIVDFDTIDLSNLQRQILYTPEDLGKSKAQTAAQRIRALNPHVEVQVYETALNADNALAIIAEYDLVADGTDNFPTRYLVNDACVLTGKINVYASIFRYEGQVSVFNFPLPDGKRGLNYRNLYPEPPPPGTIPSCAEGGVLGVLPGIIGSMQANEVIKVITGIGEPLVGKLFLFDAASMSTRSIKLMAQEAYPITSLRETSYYCTPSQLEVPSISVETLEKWRSIGHRFQLIDVRQPEEYARQNLGGLLIPLGELLDNLHKIDRQHPVVIHCQSGARSKEAILLLQRQMGWQHLFNLLMG
ncbi:molybdopterin-synthase adenylyltransferase MoeB [Haliscomenobacter sp.]|uniref:molybdopterin-synthase adenylyltransferase MoeB n=1 Tax=Haliscomenobacter sp. TaxID=2717303 RepID=UPI0035934EC7